MSFRGFITAKFFSLIWHINTYRYINHLKIPYIFERSGLIMAEQIKEKISLKIGLYNSIPDIGDDHFESYKQFVIKEFRLLYPSIHLDVTIGNKFDPYGSLDTYFSKDGFDLMEMDMARLDDFKTKVCSVKLNPDRYIQANLDAVMKDGQPWAYPTLACGNFIIELRHNNEKIVEIRDKDYKDFKESADKAQQVMVDNSYHARLLGGKLDDRGGWYLPFIYLDGFIDLHNPATLLEAINNVINGKPDMNLISRLKEFATYFQDARGNYEDNEDKIIENLINGRTVSLYGFSEKLGEILAKTHGEIKAYGALSPTMGSENHVIVFTDGLVTNKVRYENASSDKQQAINDFIQFFTSEEIREKFVLGKDLTPPKVRYLLPPLKEFYEKTNDIIYLELYKLLRNGVCTPVITDTQRKEMEKILKPLVFGK